MTATHSGGLPPGTSCRGERGQRLPIGERGEGERGEQESEEGREGEGRGRERRVGRRKGAGEGGGEETISATGTVSCGWRVAEKVAGGVWDGGVQWFINPALSGGKNNSRIDEPENLAREFLRRRKTTGRGTNEQKKRMIKTGSQKRAAPVPPANHGPSFGPSDTRSPVLRRPCACTVCPY